jgi:hypothetical protein
MPKPYRGEGRKCGAHFPQEHRGALEIGLSRTEELPQCAAIYQFRGAVRESLPAPDGVDALDMILRLPSQCVEDLEVRFRVDVIQCQQCGLL